MDNLRGDRIIQLAALDVGKPLPRKTLNVGDPLLAPYAGCQAGFDAWNDEWNQRINEGMAKKQRQNLPTGILADGTLVNADGEPIIAGARFSEQLSVGRPNACFAGNGRWQCASLP